MVSWVRSLFGSPLRHQHAGADLTAFQHREAFRDNVATLVLFYTPSAKTTKAIFEEYAGELSQDEFKQLIARLKELKFTHLVLFLRIPMGIEYFFELKDKKNWNIYNG